MRVDVVSIFPAYLDALDLSLPGKARRTGLLDLHVHDLRTWTEDRHRTVDDAPYGGGAGMVMKPEPWGQAPDAPPTEDTVLVVPTPAGERFTQAHARALAAEQHLVVACGRYEGIDQRVVDHAATRMRVVEVSLGDYVLNGGEVAALAVLEAVVRLLPGFMGNPESLAEESHESGLLEYPVYTRPPSWRGLDVPEVLLGGDHGAVERWRHTQSLSRTAARRPDLLPPSALAGLDTVAGELGEAEWRPATPADAGEILTLQRACWLQEAMELETLEIPALHEDLDQVLADLDRWRTWVLRSAGRLIGGVRGQRHQEDPTTWVVGRLMIAPDLQGRGLGRWLLAQCEAWAPDDVTSYALVTGGTSAANQRMYKRAGYRPRGYMPGDPIMWMTKKRR